MLKENGCRLFLLDATLAENKGMSTRDLREAKNVVIGNATTIRSQRNAHSAKKK